MKVRIYKRAKEIYEIAKTRKIKHKYKIKSEQIEYINDDPVLSVNYHFYKQMLAESGKLYLVEKYELDDRIYAQEELSELSDAVFKIGSIDYEYLVGIHTLYGWKPMNDPAIIREKLQKWLNNDFHPTWMGDKEMFYVKFRQKVRDIFRWREGKLKATITLDEFVENIANTSTSGSAYDPGGPRAEVIYNGREEKMPNTKFGKSISLSAEQRKERILRKEKQKSSVAVKVEFFPKVRLIVSSGYNTFMKMKFVDSWLKEWMHGYSRTTLTMTKKQLLEFWIEFAKTLGINIPIDQSAFDHHVDKRMVMIMIEEITELLKERGIDVDEHITVNELIRFALDGGEVKYTDENGVTTKLEYASGIQSGWFWTAFFDTIANEAEYRVAVEFLKIVFSIEIIEWLFNAQGDDLALRMKMLLHAVAIVCALRSFGFEIHPKKTFYSEHHNEYLRRYAKEGEINGYPVRMINNVLWIYPGDVVSYKILEKLASTTAVWVKLFERLKIPKERAIRYIISDLKGQKVSREVIDAYLSTDKVLGGAQMMKGKQYLIGVTKETLLGKVDINDVGYKEFHLRFGKFQSREMESWMLTALKFPSSINGRPTRKDQVLELKETKKIEPLRYNILKTYSKPTTPRDEKWPVNVIFGESKELLGTVYPQIDSFIAMGHAPASWIYSYLSGHLKIQTPHIQGMSEEFAGLVYHEYQASIIQAMYSKKNVPEKWLRINQYAEETFSDYIHTLRRLPKMY